MNNAGVDQSLELRDLEKVFYPLAIRVKVVAPIQSSAAPLTQLTSAEVSSLASNDKAFVAPPTSSKKEVLLSDKTSKEVGGKTSKEVEKEKEPEEQRKELLK